MCMCVWHALRKDQDHCPDNKEPSRDESEHEGKKRYHQDQDPDRDRDHGEEDRKEERAEPLAKDIADDEHIPSMNECMYVCINAACMISLHL